MRLVDADKNRDDFMQFVYDELASDSTNDRANRIIGAYDDLPTVEAAPIVHGKWDMFGCCDQCGYGDEKQDAQYIAENYKYCPHCGAKMDGERIKFR